LGIPEFYAARGVLATCYTDALAVAESLGTPPDAGWLVFADLEADVGNATSDPAGGRP
jgi:hypothetical protein